MQAIIDMVVLKEVDDRLYLYLHCQERGDILIDAHGCYSVPEKIAERLAQALGVPLYDYRTQQTTEAKSKI